MYARWRLLIHENNQNEIGHRSFELKFGENKIGRGSNKDIILPSIGVSRDHASIFIFPYSIILLDYSTNGTLLNDFTIHLRDEELYDGDIIKIGQYTFLLTKEFVEDIIELE